MNDQDVINAFVAYLRKVGFPDLKVDRWPDKENRKTSDIDAIAGYFAIERTSIDTLPNQRRDSDWFRKWGVKFTVDPCSKLIRVKSRLDPSDLVTWCCL